MADTQETETPAAPEQAETTEATEEATPPATEAPADPAEAPAEAPAEGAAPEEVPEGTGGDGGGEQAEQEGDKQPDGDAAPEAEAPAEGEAKEGEATPAGEGEGGAVEGEKTEDGEEKPQTPAAGEGEQQTEGEAEKQEGEPAVEEGGEKAVTDGGEAEGEGKEAPDGEVKPEGQADGEGGAEGAAEGEQAPAETGEGPADAGDGEAQAEGEAKEEGAEQTDTPREEEGKSPLPQSDTFAEGERPESTLGVGEKLSREPTPTGDQGETIQPDMLVPTTPDRQASPEMGEPVQQTLYEEEEREGDDDMEAEEPQFDRDLLIERYHAALQEREQLQGQNYQLQHKLAEYFRKKKADERQDYDKNVTDQEQRYLKYMAQLEELRRQEQHERENSQLQIEEFKDRCEEKKAKVDEERSKFMDFRKQVALNAINSRSGKPIPPKDIEQYLSNANRKEGEVVTVRLENIKLKNKLKKKEQQLKSKEELAEGLHLIDFEQLKIENQTYNEKIEERNEELLKLRKKITSTVQVLTHLKEKLQFVYAENHVQKGNLKDVEAYVAQRRDILSRTKQARDSLRIDNQRLRQNCGLLGNEPLLRDFEERKDESDDLKDQLESLRMQHAELTLNCNQVRRKIEQARSGRP
ncbi:cilia- and flagella-associated protein 184-like [Haliotis cracherodii]|uniref:cilia- and flagella-associated protein 184-like n=1 Tax=Haliotis cracherodii TaxID=6455 RepID=UPI0039EB5505